MAEVMEAMAVVPVAVTSQLLEVQPLVVRQAVAISEAGHMNVKVAVVEEAATEETATASPISLPELPIQLASPMDGLKMTTELLFQMMTQYSPWTKVEAAQVEVVIAPLVASGGKTVYPRQDQSEVELIRVP